MLFDVLLDVTQRYLTKICISSYMFLSQTAFIYIRAPEGLLLFKFVQWWVIVQVLAVFDQDFVLQKIPRLPVIPYFIKAREDHILLGCSGSRFHLFLHFTRSYLDIAILHYHQHVLLCLGLTAARCIYLSVIN
eukprot:maker-scaffold_43-snap-gene-1.39-mRNA-1 protein AED:0.14 eAED:0.37 QI:0/0/0.5/1/0/0/2/55/132